MNCPRKRRILSKNTWFPWKECAVLYGFKYKNMFLKFLKLQMISKEYWGGIMCIIFHVIFIILSLFSSKDVSICTFVWIIYTVPTKSTLFNFIAVTKVALIVLFCTGWGKQCGIKYIRLSVYGPLFIYVIWNRISPRVFVTVFLENTLTANSLQISLMWACNYFARTGNFWTIIDMGFWKKTPGSPTELQQHITAVVIIVIILFGKHHCVSIFGI